MGYSGEKFDVIVVGGGVMGSAAAYNVAKRGHSALLLEQFDLLHQRGSSHGESRTIRATYPESYYSSMVMEAEQLWELAQSEVGYRVYHKSPQLDMGPSDSKSLRCVIANCHSTSMPCRVLDPAQVAHHFSGKIAIPEDWVGVLTELGGVIKPTKAVSMFQTLAIRNGAVLMDNMEVSNICKCKEDDDDDDDDGGVVVYTSNGDKFCGKKCVVTVGAWTKKLVERVTGLSLPIQPLETYICYWKIKDGHQGEFTIEGGFPTFASYGEPYVYGTPSLEFPGLIKIGVHAGQSCDPDKRTWGPPVALELLKRWIEERFSGLIESTAPAAVQSCMYSMTPDEDFVIDFLGGELGTDVAIAGGFSGHGFKMAPLVGRILADMALDGEAKGVQLQHFKFARFGGNSKGNLKEFEDQVKPLVA